MTWWPIYIFWNKESILTVICYIEQMKKKYTDTNKDKELNYTIDNKMNKYNYW